MDERLLRRFLDLIAGLKHTLRFGAVLLVIICGALIYFLGQGDITQKMLPFVLVVAVYPMTLVVSMLPDLDLSPLQKFIIALVCVVLSVGFIALSFVMAVAGSPRSALITGQAAKEKEWQEKYEGDMDEFRKVAISLAVQGRKLSAEEYSKGFLELVDKLPPDQRIVQELRAGRLADFFLRYLECLSASRCEKSKELMLYMAEFWYVCEPLIQRMRNATYGQRYAEAIEVAARPHRLELGAQR